MKRDLRVMDAPAFKKFLNGLWRTDLFQNSSYVSNWVDQASKHPFAVSNMVDTELEAGHFGSYFGMMYLRDYDDPVTSDLYYLHEIIHIARAQYQSGLGIGDWFERVSRREFSVSTETEAVVYFAIPGLRERSFKHRIWADAYLSSITGDIHSMEQGRENFSSIRYDLIKAPDIFDYNHLQLALYVKQNLSWAKIWSQPVQVKSVIAPAYEFVERHMVQLQAGNVSCAGHKAWLKSMSQLPGAGLYGPPLIPFFDQARCFSQVYWDNKRGYPNSK